MPYLRYSRDKRGYENTYVFDGSKTDGHSRPKLLYWFRTPPNVKVGRFSLDEEAIRTIEENNPEVTFDWNKMLKVRPPAPKPRQKGQGQSRGGQRRGRRGAPDTRSSVQEPAGEPAAPVAGLGAAAPAEVAPADRGSSSDPPLALESERAETVEADELVAEAHLAALVEAETDAEKPETGDEELDEHPVVTLMGHETLARLRARYAELQARIAERALEPAQAEEIRVQAERLDPDRWTGIEEAVARIERFEAEADAVKTELSQHPPKT